MPWLRRSPLPVLILALAACTSPSMPELPEGVTCDDEARAIIQREGLPPQADITSDEYSPAYALGWFNTIGCEMPLPDLDDL